MNAILLGILHEILWGALTISRVDASLSSNFYSYSVTSAMFKSYAITDCQMCHFAL